MRRQDNAYALGQKFFNPNNRNTWVIYCCTFDEMADDWRYNLIMGNSSQPRVIEIFGLKLINKVKKKRIRINMKHLNHIISNNNLMMVKHTLDKLTSKLLKSDKVNNLLVNELKADTERLDASYLYFNEVKEDSLITKIRNKDLEGYLISQRMQIMDLEKRLKEAEGKAQINEKLASENLELVAENNELKEENKHLINR